MEWPQDIAEQMDVDYMERKSTPDGRDDLERGTVLMVAFHGPREGKYSTVQYSTVQYSTVQYSTVQ
jgi:hypothetical protein